MPSDGDANRGAPRPAVQPHVVLLVHGIRTQAEWQQAVVEALQADTGIEVIPTRYEYFDALRFLLPFRLTRARPIERIATLVRDVLAREPRPRLSVLAHSFGTYIIGQILREDGDIKLHRLALFGSILPDDYPWELVSGRVEQVVNDCGFRDRWPVLAKTVTWGYGSSGAFGFGHPRVRDRFHDLGHSGALSGEFARRYWRPFFAAGKLEKGSSDRSTTPWWLSMLTVVQVKYLLILALAGGSLFAWQPWADTRPAQPIAPAREVAPQTFQLRVSTALQVQRHGEWIAPDPRFDRRVRNGDLVQLSISGTLEHYLYVFLHSDGDGTLLRLYPRSSNRLDARVPAGREVVLPEPERFFRVVGKPGREDFYVLASLGPLPEVEELASLTASARPVSGLPPGRELVLRGVSFDQTAPSQVSLQPYSFEGRELNALQETLAGAGRYWRRVSLTHVP